MGLHHDGFAVMSELEEHAVPFFMVRTKVDLDVWNNRKDNSADESTTLDLIKADMASHIQHPYLVSCRDPGLYDMPRLLREMFPNVKQQLDASAPVFVPESLGVMRGSCPRCIRQHSQASRGDGTTAGVPCISFRERKPTWPFQARVRGCL